MIRLCRWAEWSVFVFSSPELSGSQGELIVYPYSGVRCRRRQQCLNIFSSETALPIKAKFYVEPPWEGGTKVYINGHMTKMAAMPIYCKTFKNLLLQNQKSYDLETWHVALGTQALQNLYKWWPWVNLDLFYGKVKLGHLYVWMGKTVIKSFNEGKLAAKDYIDWIILLMKKIWPQGVVCPCPGAIYFNHHFQTSSPLKPLGQSKPNFMWSLLGKGERKFI